MLYVSSSLVNCKKLHLTNCLASDGTHGRILHDNPELTRDQSLTVESCIESCGSQNFTLAGMEFAGMIPSCRNLSPSLILIVDECYCGNVLVNGAEVADDTDCNMGCTGNSASVPGAATLASTDSS